MWTIIDTIIRDEPVRSSYVCKFNAKPFWENAKALKQLEAQNEDFRYSKTRGRLLANYWLLII